MNRKTGEILLGKGLISSEKLEEALLVQKKQGGRIGWILTTLGYVKRQDLFEALSEHYGKRFVSKELETVLEKIDKKLSQKIKKEDILNYQAIPYQQQGNRLIILNAYPGNQNTTEFFKKEFLAAEVEEWIITDLDLIYCSKRVFGTELLDEAVAGMFNRHPDESAYKVFSFRQIIFFISIFVLLGIFLYFEPIGTLQFLLVLSQLLFFIMIAFKFVLSIAGSIEEITYEEKETELRNIKDSELPVYTILIPVFKEPQVVGSLINALKKLDYPQSKLDIILLLEEVDKETLDAAKKASPPSNWRFLIVPKSMPQTKPKACNYGLEFSRGEYLVIYDAEDIPEPNQLKKAYLAFKNSPPSYVCFQGALNYFNRDQNLLTKLFTLEYSYWFDYMLPGLYKLGLPIPLGGTSNHFKVKELKKIGGWDPFNTTEDADLGIRAAGENYQIGIIRSTTFEESNSQVWNWIRQRSRWIKGYMQTALVYNRKPVRMLKKLGLKKWLSFQLFIVGTPITFLLNPILWIMFFVWLFFKPDFLNLIFPPQILFIALFNFLIGNFIGIYMNMMGAFRRKYYKLIIVCLINPLYWILHSIASYKALWQLLTRPHYWEKTVHGLTSNNGIPGSDSSDAKNN